MAYQLILNIDSPSILSSLKKVLGAMDGVTIVKKNGNKKSATDIILADSDVMASIKRGEQDIAQGKSIKITSSEIRNMLGL